eukprot:scaffold317493_cov20-Prasinocladus_malaysianus.AAC.1
MSGVKNRQLQVRNLKLEAFWPGDHRCQVPYEQGYVVHGLVPLGGGIVSVALLLAARATNVERYYYPRLATTVERYEYSYITLSPIYL